MQSAECRVTEGCSLSVDTNAPIHPYLGGSSLLAQKVKNLPAVQETRVQSLGREDSLEEGLETHSSLPAWRIP